MKKFLSLTLSALASLAFLVGAVAIFVWTVGKLHQARESRDWPQVEGRVTQSWIDRSSAEHKPHVEYTYTVEGTPYASRQIAFDIFDKPGGRGRIESIVAQYPVGKTVTVYHDPQDPGTAILEPELYAPFFQPLFFAVLFLFGGCFTLWGVVRQVRYGQAAEPSRVTPTRILVSSVVMSMLVYSMLVLVALQSSVQETFVLAFGDRPLGMPTLLFVLVAQTLLYLPMPWVFWHLIRLVFQAREDGKMFGFWYLLTVGDSHPNLRRSRTVCIGGLVYFFVVGAIWISYAASCGI
jgi:hypothetical protein